MKSTNKFLSLFLSLVMILGTIFVPKSAQAAAGDVTQTVTLHKMLLGKDAFDSDKFPGTTGLDDTEYDGNEIQKPSDYFGAGSKEISGVYFALKFASGDNNGKYVKAKDGDLLTPADPLTPTDNVKEAVGGLTTDNGIKFNTNALKGDFEIDEIQDLSTYKADGNQLTDAKAVPVKITLPLVNNDGVVENAHVYPKNLEDKPLIDKNFAKDNNLTTVEDTLNNQKVGAQYENYQKDKATVTADLGKIIPYEVKTKIPKGARYKKLVWNDVMTKGLTYNEKSLEIKLNADALNEADYTLYEDSRGFELILTDAGLKKVKDAAAAKDAEITLTYSASINSNAVVDQPEKNDIKFDYSNRPGASNEPAEGQPVNKEISVEKGWAEDDKTVTEADKDTVVIYTLQEKQDDGTWKEVESVEKDYNSGFNHTFKNLDDNKTYRVVERVSKYDPQYGTFENGVLKIVNKKDTNNPNTLNPTEPKVQFGGKKFVKTNDEDKDSDQLERLAGAEFYVKNKDGQYLIAAKKDSATVIAAKAELDAAVKAYNDLTAEEQKGQKGDEAKAKINEKQVAYNKAFKENASAYTWGDKTDRNVVVLTSDAEGRISIEGLEYQTGNYKLEEKTAPAGFAKLNGDVAFDVAVGSFAGTDQELQYNKDDTNAGYGKQIRNKKVSIPQTGGIGSLIFVVAGLMIMGLAVYKIKANRQEA